MPATPNSCLVGCHESETADVLDGAGALQRQGWEDLAQGRSGSQPREQVVFFPSLLPQGLVQKGPQLMISKYLVVGT